MALFLIYGKNNTHADPIKDARGCYKIGDIVEVLDDSKHDGDIIKNPIAPPFYLVRITGVTKAQAEKYMAPYIDPATVGTENPVTLRRRQFNVEVASIPSAIRNKLLTDRYVSVSWSQVRNYIRNRMTNATAGATP
ncbi:MAG: hypothetical protein NUV51_10015 [Sulfuricaulis sp.]|nr:hypothetical protein [Sulfuricaulis sp.]